MSESLSNGPNFPLFISDHNYCRDGVYAALTELKTTDDIDRVRLAAEQLIEYQMRLPETYEQVATAFIDAGQIDSWINDFIHEDERAICRMFEDIHVGDLHSDDDRVGNEFFTQMPHDEMRRLAFEYFTDTTTPQPIASIEGYIAPEFTGSHALKYEYGFKINNAIDNFIETLPESTQIIVAQEQEIYQFSEMMKRVDSPLEYDDQLNEELDDTQLVNQLLEKSVEDKTLSNIIREYEEAKTAYATTLEEISQTPSVRVTKRHGLYNDARANVNTLSYHFNHLCDTINDTYSDKKVASRIMATLWRMDRETLGNIVSGLSNGNDEYRGTIDPAIDMYAEYFMGIEPERDEDLGSWNLSQKDVIGYYTNALDAVVEKVKKYGNL